MDIYRRRKVEKTYEEWKQAMIDGMGEGFSLEFVEERIDTFMDANHPDTLKYCLKLV